MGYGFYLKTLLFLWGEGGGNEPKGSPFALKKKTTKNNAIYMNTHIKKKYLSVNLTKYVQDCYEENHKTLIKEIKVVNKYTVHVMWIQRLNTIKMSVLPNLICGFNSIPIKISAHYFVDDKSVSKVYMRDKTPEYPTQY